MRKVLESFSSETLNQIDEIVAVDNHSHDDTLQVLKEIQQGDSDVAKHLIIIQNNQNYGLGGSQKIAYRYFEERNNDYFMIIHGDNQTNGNYAANTFLQHLKESTDVDLFLSSRFTEQSDISGYNQMRVLGNQFFNFVTNVLAGVCISDAGAGVMMVKTSILKQFPYWELTNGPQFNPQLNILYYSDHNIKIKEVPIIWSDSEESSSISVLNYCLTLFKILIFYRVNKSLLRRSGSQLFNSQNTQFSPSFNLIEHKISS